MSSLLESVDDALIERRRTKDQIEIQIETRVPKKREADTAYGSQKHSISIEPDTNLSDFLISRQNSIENHHHNKLLAKVPQLNLKNNA